MADTSQEVSHLAIYRVRGDKNSDNEWTQHVRLANGFAPEKYDTITLSYTGSDLTGVVYTLGGATVGTLTLGYTSGNLTTVVRT